MELSDAQRQAIEANALQSSWQQIIPWLVRHLGTTSATPDILVDWLLQASDRAQVSGQELLRHMEHRFWRVEAPAQASALQQGLLPLMVACGGLRWTLGLQKPPMMRVMEINR